MTRLLSVLAAFVLVAALAVPAGAAAPSRQTNAPPGNSAIDEYLETVPSATGNQRPGTPGAAGSGGGGLTPSQRAKLERLGPDGKALANAIDATAPPPATKPSHKIDGGNGRSPISAVFDAATGSDGGGGMGVFLPIVLLASLLGVIALVVLRRRSVS
jgi:hypothetical protein